MKIIYTDVLVIGGGLAGLRIGIGAKRRGHDVIILSLCPPKRSHSAAAQGGMQASLGNVIKGEGDNEDVHFEDTVRGSDWGADQEVVRMFVDTAPKAVRELAAWGLPWSRVSRGDREVIIGEGDNEDVHFEDTVRGSDWGADQEVVRMFVDTAPKAARELAAWGVPWSRVTKGDRDVIINGQKVTITERDEAHGLIAQRAFGGTNKWRTCYVSDGTGHAMLFTMSDQAIANGIPVHERAEAIALIHDGSCCYGAIVRNLITGELVAYVAKATAITGGGAGRFTASPPTL
jgi:succinate dehydrogenase/fumarate reductase flavoprotein subunit